jgi:hypothetical protein
VDSSDVLEARNVLSRCSLTGVKLVEPTAELNEVVSLQTPSCCACTVPSSPPPECVREGTPPRIILTDTLQISAPFIPKDLLE